jgi:tetratricopeptide (TPR) repeat protein
MLTLSMRRIVTPWVITLWAAAAAAQPDDPELRRARKLFKKAEVHFSLGEFDKALRLYKNAYRIKQLPEFLFNIGQCYRHQDQCKGAVFHFRQFLLHQPNAPEKREVRRLIHECEAKLAKAEREKAAAAKRDAAAAARPPKEPRLSRLWFWVGAGTAVALLTTAVVTAVLARSKNDEFLDPDTPVDRRQELKDQGEALEVTSWATLGAGVVAVGGAVALYFLSQPEEGEPAVSVSPAPGGGVLQVFGRF